jgi:hypothetical protein
VAWLKSIFKLISFTVLSIISIIGIFFFISLGIVYFTDWVWTHGELTATTTAIFSVIAGVLLARWMVYE